MEGVLTSVFNANLTVSPEVLKKALKASRSKIFLLPSKTMGPIHALMLQLVANGILKLGITDSNKVGKQNIHTNDVDLKLSTTVHDGITQPAHMVECMWKNMSYE